MRRFCRVRSMEVRLPALALVLLLISACSWPGRGKVVKIPEAQMEPGDSPQRITTSQPDGLRVLWNGITLGPLHRDSNVHAFMASSDRQLESLWQEIGRPPPAPTMDFGRFVVFGVVLGDSPCFSEIVAAEVQGETLSLHRHAWLGLCEHSVVPAARIFAVPRAILPPQVTLVVASHNRAFHFKVPTPKRAGRAPHSARSEVTSEPVGPSLGTVALPGRGSLALRELADGTEVWVVHDRDGSVHVLAATVDARPELKLQARASWDGKLGRFESEHDAHGRHVHGAAPMHVHRTRGVDEHHISVHESVPAEFGPIQAREDAPALDGAPKPYETLTPKSALTEIADGRVGVLKADLVWRGPGPARICTMLSDPDLQARLTHCDAEAPIASGTPHAGPGETLRIAGLLIVRRVGDHAMVLAVKRD